MFRYTTANKNAPSLQEWQNYCCDSWMCICTPVLPLCTGGMLNWSESSVHLAGYVSQHQTHQQVNDSSAFSQALEWYARYKIKLNCLDLIQDKYVYGEMKITRICKFFRKNMPSIWDSFEQIDFHTFYSNYISLDMIIIYRTEWHVYKRWKNHGCIF